MTPQVRATRVFLGPAVVAFLLSLFKAHLIARHIFRFPSLHLFPLIQGDLLLLAALLFVPACSTVIRSALVRLLLFAITVVLTAWFAVDFITVVFFNTRLTVGDAVRFSGEGALLFHWISPASIAAISAGAFILFVPLSSRIRTGRTIFVGAALVLANGLLPLAPVSEGELELIAEYRKPINLGLSWTSGDSEAEVYSAAEIARYRHSALVERTLELPPGARNVVLLVVESLSAADSLLVSGISNRLPGFDRLSARGRIFTNFFANYSSSEGGLIALHSALPPIHFPGASQDIFGEYSRFPSVPASLRARGARSGFLTGAMLSFLNLETYARAVFDSANGRDEVARFAAAPRYSFEAVADSVLIDEFLSRLDGLAAGGEPYFYSLVTSTTHLPYIDPRGLEPTEENVWGYVDAEITRLVTALDARGFFGDGLLAITGDHRKMLPVTAEEQARYGASARARIPLLLIGAGVPPGTADGRFFQQLDLLPLLARAASGEGALSPAPIWIERYTFHERLAPRAGDVSFFLEREGGRLEHRVRLQGARIHAVEGNDSPGDFPIEGREIIELLHGYRSRFQDVRARALQSGCRPPSIGGSLFGGAPGLEVLSEAERLGADLPNAARGALNIGRPGLYWFGLPLREQICLWVDGTLVAYRRGTASGGDLPSIGALNLGAGPHRLLITFSGEDLRAVWPYWIVEGSESWRPVPQSILTH